MTEAIYPLKKRMTGTGRMRRLSRKASFVI
jgi:hypothetical protein